MEHTYLRKSVINALFLAIRNVGNSENQSKMMSEMMPTDVVILYPGVCRGHFMPHVHFWICVSNVGILCSFTGLASYGHE